MDAQFLSSKRFTEFLKEREQISFCGELEAEPLSRD